jgi:hypothetical protein
MVKKLTYAVHVVCVLSAVLAWIVVVPILDLLDPNAAEAA